MIWLVYSSIFSLTTHPADLHQIEILRKLWVGKKWLILFNPLKTEVKLISNIFNANKIELVMDDTVLKIVEIHKHLGAYLSSNNKWSKHMSRLMTKPTKWHVRPAKTQISLGTRPVWSESSLSTWRKLGSLATHWAHSEGSDQTGRMPRLIWVFAGRKGHYVGFVMRRLILTRYFSQH